MSAGALCVSSDRKHSDQDQQVENCFDLTQTCCVELWDKRRATAESRFLVIAVIQVVSGSSRQSAS